MENLLWNVTHTKFEPKGLHHSETVFTIGNGYLSTRGAFEEGYPGDHRATFIHGVFDAVPIVMTELANAPDWLPLTVLLDGERFSLDSGQVESFTQSLNLCTATLTRTVRWRSPAGRVATLTFERFASLDDPHLMCLRCRVTPEFNGELEFRAALNGNTDNEGIAHWHWLGQGQRGETVFLHNRTRQSQIEVASAMRVQAAAGRKLAETCWDAQNTPTRVVCMAAAAGEMVVVDKFVAIVTSRDEEAARDGVVAAALERVAAVLDWAAACQANAAAWAAEWERSDVIIEGDPEAQLAIRFNLYHMLIAAPRQDDRVNIGAKTLSGFGYRGHAFWDTEIFMLPLFTYTAPHIARNLLNYRYRNLAGARQKAQVYGLEGALFPWESADTGTEVTPAWVPHFADRTRLVRIWTGDIEYHISADIAYAVYQYWQATGDDAWFIARGAEIILDTAKFWAARAEWNEAAGCYEYSDVIGPDEYHEHVDNNFYTNRMAQWNLQTALEVLAWLEQEAPERAAGLVMDLDLTPARLAHWQKVIDHLYLPVGADGLIEQFAGYFQRRDVDLAALEPRTESVQVVFGIEGTNQTQALKQPDVLMLFYLLRSHYSDEMMRVNYDYYTPRTDHTFGSSLGPSIQAIMACEMGLPEDAYEHFMRAARADLYDVRGNAGDGIHAASAGGLWQAIVFGFGGLRIEPHTPDGWKTTPRLPAHWRRLAFKFYYRGKQQLVDISRA